MSRNIPLLEQTLQHVLDNPEHHTQGSWVSHPDIPHCATAGCFAGWALMLDGLTHREVYALSDVLQGVETLAGWRNGVSHKAGERLGLTFEEARILFDGDNSREMLTLMVKDLVNGDDLQPTGFYFEQSHYPNKKADKPTHQGE